MWNLGSLQFARGPGTSHRAILLELIVSKRIDFVMRRQTALSSASSCITRIGLLEVSDDDDILKFAINRGLLRVYHVLARRTTAGIHCGVGNGLQRTALTTAFMHQVAKVAIGKACAELRGQ